MSKLETFPDRFWKYFAHDIAIDLGTANTLVYTRGKGIVMREPSTVAIHRKSRDLLAVGSEAKKMIGKTPANIVAVRPLQNGVISDFEIAEAMLKYFIRRAHKTRSLWGLKIPRPRLAIGIPSGITEVERKAVVDAALQSGARKVYLLEEPMAAAIGAKLPVEEAVGSMVLDVGGGTTEIAVVSLGGIVVSRSIRVAGDEFDSNIIDWAKTEHNMLIGESSAERLKLAVGSAWIEDQGSKQAQSTLRGRDLRSGLPKEVKITEAELLTAIERPLNQIVESVKEAIEETPPELLSDLYQNGMVLTGGGALLKNLDQRLAEETQMPIYLDEDPLTTVVRGCGEALEQIKLLDRVRVIEG